MLKLWSKSMCLSRKLFSICGIVGLGMIFLSLIAAFFALFPIKEKIEADSIKSNVMAELLQIPLSFERNEGQTDESVKYLTRGRGYTFYFTPEEMIMALHRKSQDDNTLTISALKFQFVGANPNPMINGIDEQENKSNYFIGNDPNKWRTNVSNFAKVCYRDMYPGIDVVFYGNQKQLEYDICVSPGKNPSDARFRVDGALELSVDNNGNLHILMEDEQNVQIQMPYVYQMMAGNKVPIDGQFVLLAQNEVGFKLGAYDTSKMLIIDPVILSYSTYLGGPNADSGSKITVDSSGNAYITGTTGGGFPITPGAFQTTFGGTTDAFVTKLNPAGSALVYSTYLGGSNDDNGIGIAIDSGGNAYVAGFTNSPNFPTTGGAFQTSIPGFGNGFVTKLNPTGSSLVYSTYLGGSIFEQALGIALDGGGNAYVSGVTFSADFPTTGGAFQTVYGGNGDAFVTKLNPTGSALVYSTFLGGSGQDVGIEIALDAGGNAYVVGFTESPNFPTTPGAFQTVNGGGRDAFVTKLNPAGSALVYSTYLGGIGADQANGIAVDNFGNAYVSGTTESTNFPTTAGAFQTAFGGGTSDAFVTKLNPAGSALVYSTYLGGSGTDGGTRIVVDSIGNAYLTGSTSSTNFPITADAFQSTFGGGPSDVFITKLNPAGSALVYSTYFGGTGDDSGSGIALDNNCGVYVTGLTSGNFPTTAGGFQTTYGGGATDAFVLKFIFGGPPIITSVSPNSGPTTGGTVVAITGSNFTNTSAVFFGITPATSFIVNSDTEITAISPPHDPGVVDITVTTPCGTSAITSADQFNYCVSTTTTLSVSPNPVVFGDNVTLQAQVTPSTATGTVTFFDGQSPIGTSSLVNGTATLTVNNLSVGSHSLSAVYNGDSVFCSSTSNTVVLIVVPKVFKPRDLKLVQRENIFATQKDIINILTWEPPHKGADPVEYRIFRDRRLTKLIAVIPANHHLRLKEHNRKEGKRYTYFVVSVDQFGNFSKPAVASIIDH